MRRKGDLSDFGGALVVSARVFQKLSIYKDFHTHTSPGFIGNGEKVKYPGSSSSINTKFIVEI